MGARARWLAGVPTMRHIGALIVFTAVMLAPGISPAAPPCPETDLGSELPASATGTTIGGAKQTSDPSCGSTGDAPDATFLWTAPSAGAYAIDTQGSDFDTLLSMRQETCDGSELACNDDADAFPPQSSAQFRSPRG